MLTSQIEKLANSLIEQEHCGLENKEILVYGLSSAVELGLNIFSTIIVGAMFGMTIEGIIFLVSFSLLRTYAGGYHARTAGRCYFVSVLVVVAVLLVQRYQMIGTAGYVLLLLVAVPIIWRFTPLEDENKPLDEVETRVYRKKTLYLLALEFAIMIVGYCLTWQSLFQSIALAIVTVAFSLLLGAVKNTLQSRKG